MTSCTPAEEPLLPDWPTAGLYPDGRVGCEDLRRPLGLGLALLFTPLTLGEVPGPPQ